MEQLSPDNQAKLEKVRAYFYHWSHVADLVFQAFSVTPSNRQFKGDIYDADRSASLGGTLLRVKKIQKSEFDKAKRQEIIDEVLAATNLPPTAQATFDWEDYAEFIGDTVDYFDEALSYGNYYDPISAA